MVTTASGRFHLACHGSFILCLLACAVSSRAEAPKLTYLFPAGAAPGTTATVTAGGSFREWPVAAWVNDERLQVDTRKEKGKLAITVAPETPPGTYWLRLHTAQGSSDPRPFVVGTLPEVMEQEPNETLSQAQSLESPILVNGVLGKSGDVDGFVVHLRKGATVIVSLQAHQRLGSPMDGVLQICSPDGFVLSQNDDERGLDPQIAYTAPRDGNYVVRVFAFPATPDRTIGFAGASNFVYRLTITTGPFLDHAMPMCLNAQSDTTVKLGGWNLSDETIELSPWNPAGRAHLNVNVSHPDTAGVLHLPVSRLPKMIHELPASTPLRVELPVAISGRIDAVSDVDRIEFSARKGQRISVQVESRSRGYPLDAVLRLKNASGRVLSEADDDSRQADPSMIFTIPADGTYELSIRDLYGFGGLRFVYRLVIEDARPDFRLSLNSGTFMIQKGKPLKIPVSIERQHGFAKPIVVSAEGLPDGVSSAAVKSVPKGKSAKAVELSLQCETMMGESGTIQIVGRIEGDDQSDRLATFTIVGHEMVDPWLSIVP